METARLAEIAMAMGGKLQGSDADATGVSIDSRAVHKGDLFVAIKGPNFDGHDFVNQALSAGAAAAVVGRDRTFDAVMSPLITVNDTAAALQAWARHYRDKFDIPMAAVTGTNGKTTTKEMIAAVLSTSRNVLKNEGNFNNQYGIPLSLFRLSPAHTAAVMELGMSSLGEIAGLCGLVRPVIGVITNVGEGHTQFLNSIANVARAKAELFAALPRDGAAIANADDQWVMKGAAGTAARVIRFGIGPNADVWATDIKFSTSGASFSVDGQRFTVPMLGGHNVYNALAAIATGDALGIPREQAARALAGMRPMPMRLEPVSLDKFFLINDAYNANPASMRAALETLAGLERPGRKVAILGDMLELGEIAEKRHWEIGYLAGRRADAVFTVGPLAAKIHQTAEGAGAEAAHFASHAELIARLPALLKLNDVILVKASRGMHFEQIVNAITQL
ncbi:MAG: UDP-N-acetylmuramoyl-tripeptide--D-alanyl-D-alanine ligase [Candidatus Edwardsbacteria bacterium]|nr:UDP-N-acetylmuramoyl-tripeptide--D-alanyl-D-alanine ligase [Candidatus Edwardsbacteria bacterium]